MCRLQASLVFVLVALTLGCDSRTLPPPSGSPNDAQHREERLARKDYIETGTIKACPEVSTQCIPARVQLEHHFFLDGQEKVFVEEIEPEKGKIVAFEEAPVPGRVADRDGQMWDLKW